MPLSVARGLALLACLLAAATAAAQVTGQPSASPPGSLPSGNYAPGASRPANRAATALPNDDPFGPQSGQAQGARQTAIAPPNDDPFATKSVQARPARAAAPLYITGQTDVVIPFTVNATDAKGRPPAKVRIYVSLDQGRNWDLYQEVRPEDKGFRFRPRRDAEFWFATEIVAADGTTERVDQRVAQMRLIIDTEKPRIQLIPQLDHSGKLHLTWNAADTYLDSRSCKVEWQDPSTGQWQRVSPTGTSADAAGNQRGQVNARGTITPTAGATSIVLRAEVGDTAGNKTFISKQFELQPATDGGHPSILPSAPGGGALAQRWTPEQNDPYTRQPLGADPAAPRMQPNTALADVRSSNTLPPPRDPSQAPEDPRDSQSPQLVRNPFSSTSGIPARGTNTGELLPPADRKPADRIPAERNPLATAAETLPAPFDDNRDPNPTFNGPDNQFRPPAEAVPREAIQRESPPRESLPRETLPRENYSRPEPINPEPIESSPIAPRRVESVSPPLGNRPRMTKSKRFSLDYDIEAVGPEGVADVELWGTADQGQTWARWGSDPDRASPFEVEVSNEAVYGFRIVIVGKNGLASNSPQAGDAADIWVGVDQAKPHARLTGATIAGGEQAGKLEIRWDARDEHFGPRPITLAVSDRAAGPFTPIAAGLPNSGTYYWEFDPRVRRQLFLRLEAQDEAGNLTVDQLTDPISIEGLAPKGRIRDIAPQSDAGPTSAPQAFRSPLFR